MSVAGLQPNLLGIGVQHFDTPADLYRAAAAGAGATHVSFNWDNIEPIAPNGGQHDYHWDAGFDQQVDLAESGGLEMFAYSGSTPAWANPHRGSVAFGPPDRAYVADFQAFFTALAQRYCGRVRYYEFWNEPNGDGWNADSSEYVYWLQEWYSAMKAGCEDTVLATGGLDCNMTTGNSCPNFMTDIFNYGGGSSFDAVSLHPYGDKIPNGDNTQALNWNAVDAVSNVLAQHGQSNKRFWLDEWGFPWGDDEPLKASLVDTALQQIAARPDVFEARYVSLTDLNDGYHWGLVESDANLTPRQSWYAFCNAANGGMLSVPADRWKAEYFGNPDLAGYPYLVRDEGPAFIDHHWGTGGPLACGVGIDGFSARWTRQISFAGSGWTFAATADDGVRLRIDGQLIIDAWQVQGPTTYYEDVILTPGLHTVVMEYYENSGDATAQLSWTQIPLPAAPTNFTATAVDNTSIRLNWSDNSNNEMGFELTTETMTLTLPANSTTHLWGSLPPGTGLCFMVRAINASGGSAWSPMACASTPFVPATPTGVTAVPLSTSSIRITWTDNASNETKYVISNGVTSVDLPANTTTYTWQGLAQGTYMCFQVKADNAYGSSPWSQQDCATTPTVPSMPTSQNAIALNGTQIRVTWTDTANNETGFEINNGSTSASVAANTTSYTWPGLPFGTYMCFRIRAVNTYGSSPWTNFACATTLAPPAAPSGQVAVAISGSQIRVSWVDNSNNENTFEINNGTASNSVGANTTSYTWSGLSPGTYMCFRIRSWNNIGSSSWTPYACATTMTAPAAPSGQYAVPISGTELRVGWADNSNNEGGFEINNGTITNWAGANSTSYAWSGLSPGTSMCFRVRSYNSVGYSAWTPYACATTMTPPAAPTNQFATAISGSQIRVSWTDTSNNEGGFEINNGVTTNWVGANSTSYTWSGLSLGTYMCFRVRSYNSIGFSAWTPYTCTTTMTAPAAPSGQLATAISSSSIRITWWDNSNNEGGFEVNNGVTTVWVGPNSTSYTWSGLASKRYMCFHVRSYNSVGFSAWTPYTCTTTF